jgi:hypothetical protein
LGLKLEAGVVGSPSPYVRGEVSYPLSTLFLLQSAYAHTLNESHPASLQLGARAQLDVFHYVPWAGLLGSYMLSDLNHAFDHISAGVELGLDRKLSDRQAVSLSLRLPALFMPASEGLGGRGAWRLGLSWRYDWLLFDPFDE